MVKIEFSYLDVLAEGDDEFKKEYLDFSAIFKKSETDLADLNQRLGRYLLEAFGEEQLAKNSAPPVGGWSVFALYFSIGQSRDYRPALREITARTLIVHGKDDTMARAGSETSNPTSIAQAAATAALNSPAEELNSMVSAFKERHDYVVSMLNSIKGVRCIESDGSFYAFPNMQGLIDQVDGVNNDVELADYLISELGVALVPGSAFGAPGYMRLSFATDLETLKDALTRI